ncbi:MAG: hypothetical protein NTZ10_01335 [Candidatus Saganbacteria bacterium]|nr:hypothetical protein [Candidatus Saganbacteria bacterium]
MGNNKRTTVYFGRPSGRNPEHLANIMIRFFNGEYIRGVMIYKKLSMMGEPFFLLKYPSYVNDKGLQVPFFRLSQDREQKIISLFTKAYEKGELVESYPLSFVDTKVFSKVLA